MSFTVPRNWSLRSPISARRLQKEFADNITYLKSHNAETITSLNASDLAKNLATFTHLDALYEITRRFYGGRLRFWFIGSVSSVDLWAAFDVLVDSSWYVSSGTATPLDRGIWQHEPTSARVSGVSFEYLTDPVLTPVVFGEDVYNLKLMMKTEGAITLVRTGRVTQWGVEEY